MKSLFIACLVCFNFFLLSFSTTAVAAEKRRVCVNQTDVKTKKVKQVCRQVRVHKKLDGTKVPPKPPK